MFWWEKASSSSSHRSVVRCSLSPHHRQKPEAGGGRYAWVPSHPFSAKSLKRRSRRKGGNCRTETTGREREIPWVTLAEGVQLAHPVRKLSKQQPLPQSCLSHACGVFKPLFESSHVIFLVSFPWLTSGGLEKSPQNTLPNKPGLLLFSLV